MASFWTGGFRSCCTGDCRLRPRRKLPLPGIKILGEGGVFMLRNTLQAVVYCTVDSESSCTAFECNAQSALQPAPQDDVSRKAR